MLWLCASFPRLPIELRQTADVEPVAVIERRGSRRRIIACNPVAEAAGIQVGLDATVALARAPALRMLERSISQEARALKALAAFSEQFSSETCIDAARWLVWIEVGASIHYFTGLTRLGQKLRTEIAALGYTVRFGLAPTLEAAALLSRGRKERAILDPHKLRPILGKRPLNELAADGEILEALSTAGLTSIAEVAAIPAASLARRFGPYFTAYLQCLFGDAPDVRRRYRAPDRYRRHFDCTYPIDTVEGVLFPLRRLLQELQGYLRGRDVALQGLSVALEHRDAPPTRLELRITTPQRDAPQLFAVLRETLERTTLPEPVTDIRLSADEFITPSILQTDLFDDGQWRAAGWSAVLDKLRARLGEDAVHRLGLNDSHCPEKAWCVRSDGKDAEPDTLLERPLWILEQPRPMDRAPQVSGRPERLEVGWMSGQDSSRDYYRAESPEGARLWVYRDCHTHQWFLHGLWG